MSTRLSVVMFVAVLLGLADKGAAAMHWGDWKRDHCTGMGTRQYSSILWDIPWGQSWETACARMPVEVAGYSFDHPARCVNTGNMWGEIDVPDEGCPHWGGFKRDSCSKFGKRQFSAVLYDVPAGISWENACASRGATVEGQSFLRPDRCKNTGLAMWGEFDVNDSSCMPSWGTFKKDHCAGVGKRQYSAVLNNIPEGVSWEAACAQMPADVEGTHFAVPSRCKNTGLAMWGEFDINDVSCGPPSWGAFKKDQCTGVSKRQYSSVLYNIPEGVSWEAACAQMPADVEGTHFAVPSRCKNTGLAMWGEFDINDSSCAPSWGAFKKDHCTAVGKRQYSAVLHNIPESMSWELACAQTSVEVAGTVFAVPSRCKNTGLAMWGEFDVDDRSCTSQFWGEWGNFKKDHCTEIGKRQYSAVLQDIPPGVQWEIACGQVPADIEGMHFDAPARCVNTRLAMWGEFDVDDATCNAQFWGTFKKDYCTDSGKRQYSAVLHNIAQGVSWEDACAVTSATVQGVSFTHPTRCINDHGLAMWGEFEVFDPTCNPNTECTDPTLPPGAFTKTGNDGSISCDAYCANMGGEWGNAGACVKGRIVAGMNQDNCIRCVDIGRDLGATEVMCVCQPPLTGFADTHNHQFANLAFGGQAVWGQPFGPIEEALPYCTPAHGPGGVGDLMFDFFRQHKIWPPWRWLSIGHLVGGYPEFDGWPRFTSTSHQHVYEDWLFRAYQGGLRLLVMLAVNNEEACNFVNKAPGRTCDDAEAIKHQIDGAKAMERYIDEKHGGPGRGWYRIVYSPQQARQAIASGQLAVVLGAEVDYFLNCRTDADCTENDVRQRLDEYYQMGLRHVLPIHFVSNGFGGAALSNPITHGPSRFCDQEGYEYHRDPLKAPICSSRGLTQTGKFLLQELMRKKMIIDVDHMSVLARADAFTMAERNMYPLISGHTGFLDVSKGDQRHEGNLTANEVKRIRDLGGMVSVIISTGNRETITTYRGEATPVIDHQCGLTSQTFAQDYLYAVEKMQGGPVGIGTDFNAGPDLPGPRFGSDACPGGGPTSKQTTRVSYPFPVSVVGSPPMLDRITVGNKTFDINTDGLAHMGMLPDYIEDLKQQGVRPADLVPLLRSAEGYVRLWEKINATTPYLGCYRDQGDPTGTTGRDLGGAVLQDPQMTTSLCITTCRAQGFAYAGTQYGSWCFCGNSYGGSGAAGNCNMECGGAPKETCGGTWANSIYALQ